MSWYTMMYLGIMDKDKKIKPWGPYNAKGELCSIFTHSASFTSDLKDSFYSITEENLTEELKKAFPYETGTNDDNDGKIYPYFGYLPISELPKGSFIKHGYCLLTDVNAYLSDDSYFDDFYDFLSPEEYAFKLENELKFGALKPKKDCDGYEYTEHSCSEYTYFSWANYNCREYETHLIRTMIDSLENYDIKTENEFVVIKTEG